VVTRHFTGNLWVFPINDDGQATWEYYRTELLAFLSRTHGQYFVANSFGQLLRLSENCDVSRVSAGALTYQYAGEMSYKQRNALGIGDSIAPVLDAPVRVPYEGIHRMLDGLATVLTIGVLQEDEEARIHAIDDQLAAFRPGTKEERSSSTIR
jgi:hypothetical protein